MDHDYDPYLDRPATLPTPDPYARFKPGSRRLVKVRDHNGKLVRRPLTPRPLAERPPLKVRVDWRGNVRVSRSSS